MTQFHLGVVYSFKGLRPSYLSGLLLPYWPLQTLRSSGTGLLSVANVRTKTFGEASFYHYRPCLWNSLPEGLRAPESVDAFKRRLKTHLFNLSFNCIPFYSSSTTHLYCPVIFLCPLIFSSRFYYLFTYLFIFNTVYMGLVLKSYVLLLVI